MSGIRPQPWYPARGFTLIEIAIVLFIIGLVMSGIVALVNAMVVNRQIESTRTKQEAIKTALISFIARNYRLPCPALPNLAEGAANNGVEATRDTTNKLCTGLTPAGSGADRVVTGVVPWVSLGLTNESALDAYANRFTYQVVLSAAFLDSVTVSGMSGRITTHSTTPVAPGLAPAGNQMNYCPGTVNPCAAVAVVVSHGKDGYGAYTRSGSRIPFDSSVTGNDAKENVFDLSDLTKPPDSRFVVKDYSGTDANPFDDIVMVLTTNDLLTPLVVAGTFRDYSASLNSTFSAITAAAAAYAVDNKTIVSGNARYNLPTTADSPFSILMNSSKARDPWGTTILYTRGLTSIRASTTPTTVAITLTSFGPNLTAGGGDDITREITAAELQAIFQFSGW